MAAPRLTIDLDAVASNWRAMDALSGPEVQTGAVVKADAYGLGVTQVAPVLRAAGATRFFVAIAGEVPPLRHAIGPEPQIFVFAGYTEGDADLLRQTQFRPLLNSAEQAAAFLKDHPDAPCGLQLDSGMNRLGIEPEDLPDVDLTRLDPQLIISHLACADTPNHPQNAAQLARFRQATEGMPQDRLSLAATGGITLGAEYHFALTRPGVGLYGGLPFARSKPVVQLDLPVLQTRDIATGESVGYGATWIAERPSRIATLSAGYADGLLRALGSGVPFFHGDQSCPSVGRVSMDLITVDITDLETTPEWLTILGPQQSIDAVAQAAGTIGYEVLTALGSRYDRVYNGG
ncbi:MAG: alanine racemase [Pseudomonadota bacterium]